MESADDFDETVPRQRSSAEIDSGLPNTAPYEENSWEAVAEFVEKFLVCWEEGNGPPFLADYLPPDGSLRADVLLEMVKVDLDYRTQFGLAAHVEDYLDVFPEILVDGKVPPELILEEFHVRRATGEEVSAEEFVGRFPNQRADIETILGLHADEAHADTNLAPENTTPRHATFSEGDRLDDFYLMSKLGQGGFASVYLARQEAMQRLVALKVSEDKGSEAQTLAQLDHRYIVRVYDQVRLPDQKLLLLYMQFAPGGTLRGLLARSREVDNPDGHLVSETVRAALAKTGVLSPDDVFVKRELSEATWPELVCHYGIELSASLAYAHERGVLHRDLKPANVLLDAVGSCKLADFNISFASELEEQDAATSFGGSVAYMPPEQLAAFHPHLPGKPSDLDGRSDTYALAVLLWELATGVRPFNEKSLGDEWIPAIEAMIQRRRYWPTEGDWDRSDPVAMALRAVLLKNLKSNPSERSASASVLLEELSRCRQPRVALLVSSQRRGWRWLVGNWPVAAVVVATIAPNIPAALFAWFYNNENLQRSLANPADMSKFDTVQSIINGVAFPVAIAGLIWYALPVRRSIAVDTASQPEHASNPNQTLRRTFGLGRFGAWLGIVEWTIAGIAYPVTLHLLLGGLSTSDWGHFFFSHLLSGMIASAYPYFLLTAIAIRVILPRWLEVGSDAKQQLIEPRDLDRVNTTMEWFLYVAGGVPAVGIFALLFLLGETDDHHEWALKVLSLMGAFGFALVFRLYRTLQLDLEAFREVLRATDQATSRS